MWVCQTDECGTSAAAWQRVASGEHVDWQHPGQDVYLLVEGLDGSDETDDAQITPHFCTAEGNCTFDGDPAPLTVIKSEFMLTFDDGPFKHAGAWPAHATATILGALSDVWVNGAPVHATFFVVGHNGEWGIVGDHMCEGVDGYPDLNPNNWDIVQAANAAGHTLGNHTNTHNAFVGVALPEIVSGEIDECNRKLGEAGQNDHGLFRPPYFAAYAFETVVLDGAAAAERQVIWGSAFRDWEGASAVTIRDRIIEHLAQEWNTRARPRLKTFPDIVTLHDCAASVPGGLRTIVDGVRQAGFVLVHFDPDSACADRDQYQWTGY